MTFYQELAQYTNRDLFLVTERAKHAIIELAWQWEDYKHDPLKFYRESDLYIFDLAMYMQVMKERGFHDWFERMIKDFQVKTMLDFGGGIGEYTVLAWRNGIKADFLEVKDSKTLEYAQYRFKKYGINPKILYEDADFGKYDMIVAMDVFEHIPDNMPIMKKVAENCKYMICNIPQELPYGPLYPQHISHIDYGLLTYFEQVTDHLWKSKLASS